MAPIAQNGPFWAQKCCFWARNQFFVDILQIFCCHHDRAPKRQHFCVYHNAGQATGGVKEPFFVAKIGSKIRFEPKIEQNITLMMVMIMIIIINIINEES